MCFCEVCMQIETKIGMYIKNEHFFVISIPLPCDKIPSERLVLFSQRYLWHGIGICATIVWKLNKCLLKLIWEC